MRLIEREKLNAVIEEQRFAFSGMADEKTLMEIGKLLTADYIVLGEIIDMAGPVLVTVRMVDAGTGEVVWDGSKAEESTVNKVAEKEKKDARTVIRISEGIDAYDRDETEEAKKALSEARVLDPDNEVASYYLSKLSVTGSKFTVVPPLYYSRSNPASLGFIERDMGFGTEMFLSELIHSASRWAGDGVYDVKSKNTFGGIISAGKAFSRTFAAGVSLLAGYVPEKVIHTYLTTTESFFGGEAGIMLKNLSGSRISRVPIS